jgi:hypothetical protein
MSKDARGHGSNGRGVSAVQARNDRMFAMFDRAKTQGHTTFNATADKAAAATLASGPKSAPVPTHPGASGRKDMWGRTDADLKKDYGGPVRHFNGGHFAGGLGKFKP